MFNVKVINGWIKGGGFYQLLRMSPNLVFKLDQLELHRANIDYKSGDCHEFVLSGIDEYHVAVYSRMLQFEYRYIA